MLANDGASVYSVDIDSIYLMKRGQLIEAEEGDTPETCVRKSDIVITGVPTKAYRLPTEWIRPNTTVINVASYKNVDETTLLDVPGVKYVPLVGKVTVAMLERNVLRLHENYSPHAKAAADAEDAADATSAKPVEPSPVASPAKEPRPVDAGA